MSSDSTIYQDIYDADVKQGNGVPAYVKGQASSASNTVGFVIVSESQKSETVTGKDVFDKVHVPDSKMTTYKLANALFDNYELHSSDSEHTTPQEQEEIQALLDAIVGTPPMSVARQYVESKSGTTMSDDEWRAHIKKTWFESFPVGGSPSRSGFEHVFLAEWKGRDGIGGLHWWWFYAQKMSEMTYEGVDYGRQADNASGTLIPEVVTMDFKWKLSDGVTTLTKEPKGGFLVGLSVEGLMAMGIVRAMSPSGTVTTSIQGASIDFKMYKDAGRINTFYPVFKRIGTAGGYRLISAMVNSEGNDVGHEKITMLNMFGEDSESLLGWRVIGPNGSYMEFNDIVLGVGEAKTFTIDITEATLQLRNRAGVIQVTNADGIVVQTAAYDQATAKTQGAVLMWNGNSTLGIVTASS